MLNWLFANLPVFVSIDCADCKSIDAVFLSPLTANVLVKMKSDNLYVVPVRRFDMLRLWKSDANVGEWLNTYVLV
jgi:hypothetical protein